MKLMNDLSEKSVLTAEQHDLGYASQGLPLKAVPEPEPATAGEFDKALQYHITETDQSPYDLGWTALRHEPTSKEFIDELVAVFAGAATPEAAREAAQDVLARHAEAIEARLRARWSEAAHETASKTAPAALVLPQPDPTGQTYRLYKDRPLAPGMKRRQISAREHFEAEWKRYVDAQVLYMDDLRRLDGDLVTALYLQETYERKHVAAKWKVRDLVPTRSVRADRELADLDHKLQLPAVREALRLKKVAARRRQRELAQANPL
ncbi:hypothetical protein [Accumulibacter sp.]|uniref:hypothetical protein n=1 Tax=Accumulibacter sp. TaxID=2053492 RepID=UPI00258BF056|nr:hypothetical protein [Accumulibacter sp.]